MHAPIDSSHGTLHNDDAFGARGRQEDLQPTPMHSPRPTDPRHFRSPGCSAAPASRSGAPSPQ